MAAIISGKYTRYAIGLVLSSLGLGAFLIMTNPNQTSFILLLVPIILSLLVIYFATQLVLAWLGFMRTSTRKRPVVALVIACLITTVLILQTTGGIAPVDAILLALIVVIASIYIQRY